MGYAVDYLSELLSLCSPGLRQDFIRDAQCHGLIPKTVSIDEDSTPEVANLLAPIYQSGIDESFLIAAMIVLFNERVTIPVGEDPSSEFLRKMEQKVTGMHELRESLDPSRRAGIESRIRSFENGVLPALRDAVEITKERRIEWESVSSAVPKGTILGLIRDINRKYRDREGATRDEQVDQLAGSGD